MFAINPRRIKLSKGSIEFFQTARPDDTRIFNEYTFQILSIRDGTGVTTGTTQKSYRVFILDGKHRMETKLDTQFNEMVRNGVLKAQSIIVVDKFGYFHLKESVHVTICIIQTTSIQIFTLDSF